MFFIRKGSGAGAKKDAATKSQQARAAAAEKAKPAAASKSSAAKGGADGKSSVATSKGTAPGKESKKVKSAAPPPPVAKPAPKKDKAAEDKKKAEDAKKNEPKKTDKKIEIDIDVDPGDASSFDDKYTLKSDCGRYTQTKTVKDDKVPGDKSVTLEFTELFDKTTYTLEIDLGAEGSKYNLFTRVKFADLVAE